MIGGDHPAFAGAWVDEPVFAAHPGYAAILIVATGLDPGPTTERSDDLLREAERRASRRLEGLEPHALPEVMAWREAYQGFGVKPREARSSLEALLRRSGNGLPRIDRLTDMYNAVSLDHLVPIGGEDLSAYVGPARLVVASGDEPFDTIADGEPAQQFAAQGEIIWRDDAGVTCRRWNWRQCVRTRLTESTTDALFIIDGLGPGGLARAQAAADALLDQIAATAASPASSAQLRTLALGQ